MTFKNKAILCDTWEQMEHLARIAEEQGYMPLGFSEIYFENDMAYFIVDGWEYTNTYGTDGYTITTYTTFINSHPDISVEGC